MRAKLNLIISISLLAAFLLGCAYSLKPIDISHVQSNVVKGKTTMAEIEKMYGSPYNKGLSKDGTQYYYYLYANPLTSASQDFTFYFDKNGQVANYATEYPGGNPLTSQVDSRKPEPEAPPKPEVVSPAPVVPPKPEAISPSPSSPPSKETQAPATPAPKVEPPVAVKPVVSYLITIKGCNIRSEANANSKIIKTVKKGEKLEKTGKSGNWFNVKLSSGEAGWVHKDLVKEGE